MSCATTGHLRESVLPVAFRCWARFVVFRLGCPTQQCHGNLVATAQPCDPQDLPKLVAPPQGICVNLCYPLHFGAGPVS